MPQNNPYTAGKAKEYIRDNVFLHLMPCSNVLTLPNLYFGLEKMLLKDGKEVSCTEYKVNTFRAQQKIAPKGITLYYDNVKDLKLDKYDGIFLDLCGTFNIASAAVFNKIKPKTRVAVTFLMARENLELQKSIDITNREESYVYLLQNYNVFITKYINYCDTSPMCIFFGEKQ